MRNFVWLCLAVTALAIAVRLPRVLQHSPAEWSGTENERVAVALARGDGWSDALGPGTGPTAHVAPLYPLLLAGLYRTFGAYETESGRLAQQAVSLTASVLALLLLPALARKLKLPATAGWAAAFLGACLPGNHANQVNGHHEQVLAALLLIGLVWGCTSLQQSGWSSRSAVGGAGTLMGLAALLCPNLLLPPLLFFAVELLRRPGERWRILRCGGIFVSICVIVAGPWTVRNYRVLGGFVSLRSNFGLELAVGNRPGADGYTYAPGFDEIHPHSGVAERGRLARVGELTYMHEKQRAATGWIANNPLEFGRLTLCRAWLFWFSPSGWWGESDAKSLVLAIVQGLTGAGLLLGLIRLLRQRSPAGVLLLCTAVGVGLPYFFTHVEVRYYLPITGLSLLISCDFAAAVLRRLRDNLHWPLPLRPSTPSAIIRTCLPS